MTKDDATWLNICYVIFAMIVAYIAHKGVYTVGLQFGLTEKYDEFFPTLNSVFSALLGLGSAVWLRAPEDRREYHLHAIGEVRKVTWPSYPDTKKMTIVVVVVVAVFSVILTCFDVVWSKMLQTILP